MAETATRQTMNTAGLLSLLYYTSHLPLPHLEMLMHPCMESNPNAACRDSA